MHKQELRGEGPWGACEPANAMRGERTLADILPAKTCIQSRYAGMNAKPINLRPRTDTEHFSSADGIH